MVAVGGALVMVWGIEGRGIGDGVGYRGRGIGDGYGV